MATNADDDRSLCAAFRHESVENPALVNFLRARIRGREVGRGGAEPSGPGLSPGHAEGLAAPAYFTMNHDKQRRASIPSRLRELRRTSADRQTFVAGAHGRIDGAAA